MRTPSGLALIAQEPRSSRCRLGAFVSSCTSFYSIQAQEAKTWKFESKSWLLSDELEWRTQGMINAMNVRKS
jgi:hypothetical protein